MSQYLLSVHYVEGQAMPPEEEIQASFKAVAEFNEQIMASGNWVFGGASSPRTPPPS